MSDSHLPLGLPGPIDPNESPQTERPSSAAGGRGPRRYRTAEECLLALDHLAGLVAVGMILPAQANAMGRIYRDILQYHLRIKGGSVTGAPLEPDVFERLRGDPQLMHWLAPFLSDEQIASLMNSFDDDLTHDKLDFCRRFVYLDRRLIDFSDRPYLPAIYGVRDRNLVLRCSRQVEKSTFLANSIVFEACIRPGKSILFVCPREEQARRFSRDRLLPTIDQSPLIRRVLLGKSQRKPPVKEIQFKNGSRVYICAAYNHADACRGVSADLLLIDEYQDVAAGHLPVIQETLSHSRSPRTILVGTPKSIENHLELAFSQTTANEWQVPCASCHQSVVLDEHCLGPRSVVCPTCQAQIIPALGTWVPRNPAATSEGFCISHLMVPWLDFEEILERQRNYDSVRFKNECLGLSSTTGDQVVTRAQLEACCEDVGMAQSLADIAPQGQRCLVAGIDWGGGVFSRTVLTIGWMRSDYRFQVCRFERFNARDDPDYVFEQVAQLCQQFKVRFIAADGGGNGNTQNRRLVNRLGGYPNLYAIYYSMSDHPPQQDGSLRKWTVNRTGTIGVLFTRIKMQSIYFPRVTDCGSFLDEFACEIAEYDNENRTVKYTHPATQQDDALHSTNYSLLIATHAFQAAMACASD